MGASHGVLVLCRNCLKLVALVGLVSGVIIRKIRTVGLIYCNSRLTSDPWTSDPPSPGAPVPPCDIEPCLGHPAGLDPCLHLSSSPNYYNYKLHRYVGALVLEVKDLGPLDIAPPRGVEGVPYRNHRCEKMSAMT